MGKSADNTVHEPDPLDLLMASASTAHDVVEIPFDFSPKPIPYQPVTILQGVDLVRNFSGLMALFEPKLDADGKPLPKERQPNPLTVFIEAGKEAVGAFVACAVRREGDEVFKSWFLAAPDKVALPMFTEAMKVTLGEGTLDDFFTKVVLALVEAKILVLEPAPPAGKAA